MRRTLGLLGLGRLKRETADPFVSFCSWRAGGSSYVFPASGQDTLLLRNTRFALGRRPDIMLSHACSEAMISRVLESRTVWRKGCSVIRLCVVLDVILFLQFGREASRWRKYMISRCLRAH